MNHIAERAGYCFGSYPEFEIDQYLSILSEIRHVDFRLDRPIVYSVDKYQTTLERRGSYCEDAVEFLVSSGANRVGLIFQFRDGLVRHKLPIFTKTRLVGGGNGVILNLHSHRHWNFEHVLGGDLPFKEKRADLEWRGASTGSTRGTFQRYTLVSKYAKMYNIGFSQTTPATDWIEGEYITGKLSPGEQLQYKYILSVEGNDVATNLKWIRASASVPIMPAPTVESWLMESKLHPWVHYVPVSPEFDDIAEILQWCRDNDEQCEAIARNGQMYMKQFTLGNQTAVYRIIYRLFRDICSHSEW